MSALLQSRPASIFWQPATTFSRGRRMKATVKRGVRWALCPNARSESGWERPLPVLRSDITPPWLRKLLQPWIPSRPDGFFSGLGPEKH